MAKTSSYHSKQEGFLRQMRVIATHNTCNSLKDIKVSTLIIAGDNDVVIPSTNSDVLLKKVPCSKLKTLEKAGHGFSFSHAARTAELLVNFLE